MTTRTSQPPKAQEPVLEGTAQSGNVYAIGTPAQGVLERR
jgi:hypothetical protein